VQGTNACSCSFVFTEHGYRAYLHRWAERYFANLNGSLIYALCDLVPVIAAIESFDLIQLSYI
jgi:hypothetical protein